MQSSGKQAFGKPSVEFGKWHDLRYYAAQIHKHPLTLKRIFECAGLRFRRIGKTRVYHEEDVTVWLETGAPPRPHRRAGPAKSRNAPISGKL